MRISVIFNNGRRVKLAPKAAHGYLWHGWAHIAPEDAEGAKLYVAYLKEQGLDPTDRKRPEDHLPPGYTVRPSSDVHGATILLYDPRGEHLSTHRNMANVIGAADEHARRAHVVVEQFGPPAQAQADDADATDWIGEPDTLSTVVEPPAEPKRSTLPDGYEIELERGWWRTYFLEGDEFVQVGKAVRGEDEAIAQAWDDFNAAGDEEDDA